MLINLDAMIALKWLKYIAAKSVTPSCAPNALTVTSSESIPTPSISGVDSALSEAPMASKRKPKEDFRCYHMVLVRSHATNGSPWRCTYCERLLAPRERGKP